MADVIPYEQIIERIKDDVDWIAKNAYARGYNTAKAEIALSGEYERAYQRGKADAQQWIPCSEQEYPNDNREVEVTCEFTRYDGKKIRYTCHASYVHRYSIDTAYGNWEDCEEYNEEKDMYYALPGWYERVHNWDDYSYCAINDHVVAWRELPEPWRGES